MPSLDRYSGLILSFGIVLMAIAVALPIWFLISLLSIDGSLNAVMTHTDWSSFGVYLLLPVVSAVMLSEGMKSERREWLRERARAGDDRAMLPAAIKPPTVEQAEAEAEHEPLELLWRTDRSGWTAAGTVLFLAIFVTLAAMLVAAILASAGSLELSWNPLTICAAPVALELGLLGWWWSRRTKGPTGVVASNEGLRWLKAGRDKAFIPWSEARLFEVWHWGTNKQEASGYALSGERALIEWVDYSPDKASVSADGASYEEMRRRQQALLQMIIALSGLTPRTCEPDLALREDSGDITAQPRNLISWLNLLFGSVALLCFAGAPLVAAVGALLAPLTTTPLVNIYVAITMGPLGLALLILVMWAIVSGVRNAPAPDVPRPDVKLPPAPSNSVTLLGTSTPRTWRYNAVFLTIILLVAGELYALVRGFIDVILPMSVMPAWWEPHMLTITALGGASFIVGIIAIIGLFDRAIRWFVDEQGVRFQRGRKTTTIPFDMVAEMVITVEKGKVDSFKVIAHDAQRTQIAWPTDVVLSGATPAPGESPGAVFAAAVAQRAGVTPRVEYR